LKELVIKEEITMATITEDYVSFEIAKLLKEKGFDIICDKIYRMNGYLCPFEYSMNIKEEGYYLAPTLQMAMKWLREVHNIKINIFYNNSNYAIEYFEPNTQTGVGEFVFIGDGYDVYEQACEVAIKYCLENLI
jgi:hypothetical protein